MTATETYYLNKIAELQAALGLAQWEGELHKERADRWEINARDVGWKPEEGGSATWLRSMARDINDIPFMRQVIRDLSDSVDRLSRALADASSK
jgi:uncharacterized heparinase superfamily protein